MFKCKILKIENDSVFLQSSFGNFKTKNNNLSKLNSGATVNFGIRPEEISVVNDKEENSLELIVSEIDFKGSVSTINVLDNNSDKKIKIQNISSNVSKKYTSGSKVNILINPESGNIFVNENNI